LAGDAGKLPSLNEQRGVFMNPISFPGLGIGPFVIDRVAFSLFGREIYWYGLLIAIGAILAAWYGISRTWQFGIRDDDLVDAILWCIPLGVVCARLYYVLFNLEYYDTFAKAIDIRSGGLAIYGGIIGAMVTGLILCRVKKISFLNLFDLAAIAIPIGQAVGRWGNFVNQEAHGGVTAVPWRMVLIQNSVETAVHPTFFYEFLLTTGLFLFLHFYSSRRQFRGQLLLLYLAVYGLGRAAIESLRTDSLYLGPFRISQLVGIVCFVICVGAILAIQNKRKHNPELLKLIEPIENPFKRPLLNRQSPAAEEKNGGKEHDS
jgi:phosphatidylglycerol:prolipoprotein diacylglycerol transferase